MLDEAHRLKSRTSITRAALCELDVHWWLLLSGTPVQNNMKELQVVCCGGSAVKQSVVFLVPSLSLPLLLAAVVAIQLTCTCTLHHCKHEATMFVVHSLAATPAGFTV
eukprot:GHRR01028095.1.p2 GENE.GHRR01028095.1~~GHRR01028095.1.p2  ORF type:complete len:108 (+),score=33.83 GHRR01028095.1:957-1280(+)